MLDREGQITDGRRSGRAAIAALALLVSSAFISAAQADVSVGDMAPDWKLPGSDGAEHELSALRGRHVVIAFFPKAFTGG